PISDGGHAGECAVLYRSNAQSRAIEQALIEAQLPYRVYGGVRFFERAEIKDALAYLRLIANRADDAAYERVVNTPPRGIGSRTLEQVRLRARRDGAPLWEAALAEIVDGGLAGRAKNALRAFAELLQRLGEEIADLDLAAAVDHVLARSGLRAYWAQESKGTLDARGENLDELVSLASRFVAPPLFEAAGAEEPVAPLPVDAGSSSSSSSSAVSPASPLGAGRRRLPTELMAFLAHAALEAGEGQAAEGEDGVQLMTLHAAKGLEFPLVFLT